jgi:glutathione S-transferase
MPLVLTSTNFIATEVAASGNRMIIGTRRYSSWSLRGWLAVRLAGLDVEEVVVPLGAGSTPALSALTPAGLVPVLEHDGLRIWDSLAICEYCAECAPGLWPLDRGKRAIARSVAAEMHAGFCELRIAMPMNLGRTVPDRDIPAAALADAARIDQVWQDCLAANAGPFLFGAAPTIADIMYAPVVARFISYMPSLSAAAEAYTRAMRAWPLLDEWYRLAAAEPISWRLAKYE